MRMTPIKIGPAGKIGKAFAPTGAPPDFSGWAFFFGVTRGEQPLVRATRASKVAGAFLVLFWHAKENIPVLFVASYGEA
jgi:hypothetical protein